VIHKKTRGV